MGIERTIWYCSSNTPNSEVGRISARVGRVAIRILTTKSTKDGVPNEISICWREFWGRVSNPILHSAVGAGRHKNRSKVRNLYHLSQRKRN